MVGGTAGRTRRCRRTWAGGARSSRSPMRTLVSSRRARGRADYDLYSPWASDRVHVYSRAKPSSRSIERISLDRSGPRSARASRAQQHTERDEVPSRHDRAHRAPSRNRPGVLQRGGPSPEPTEHWQAKQVARSDAGRIERQQERRFTAQACAGSARSRNWRDPGPSTDTTDDRVRCN